MLALLTFGSSTHSCFPGNTELLEKSGRQSKYASLIRFTVQYKMLEVVWDQIQTSRHIDGSEKREIQKKMMTLKQDQQELSEMVGLDHSNKKKLKAY